MSLPARQLINPNTVSSTELETLPGVGPALSQRIIAARPFDSIPDLQRVPGIGPALLETLRPYLDLGQENPPSSTKRSKRSSIKSPDPSVTKSTSVPWTENPHPEPFTNYTNQPAQALEAVAPNPLDEPKLEAEINFSDESQAGESNLLIQPKQTESPPIDLREPLPPPTSQPVDRFERSTPPENESHPNQEIKTFTRRHVYWIAAGSSCLSIWIAIFLSLFIALGFLAALNQGNLQFISPAQFHHLSNRLSQLENSIVGLTNEAKDLRQQMEALQSLESRLDEMENGLIDVQTTQSTISTQMQSLMEKTELLAKDVLEMKNRMQRFDRFLEGLRSLLEQP